MNNSKNVPGLQQESQQGRVLSVTRRYVDLIGPANLQVQGKVGPRDLELCVGDLVNFSSQNGEIVVHSLLPRFNLLKRSYFNKTRFLCSNLDHVYLITAPLPLFNPTMIDRVICAISAEGINYTLVINKNDLEQELINTEKLISVYRSLGMKVITCNTLSKTGLSELESSLVTRAGSVIALVGVSGVGKSSIIKALYPELSLRIKDVSLKTGQGRQTTSQSYAYAVSGPPGILRNAGNLDPYFLIDLPGIQNYGVTHLSPDQIRSLMPELAALQTQCRFNDCWHEDEPDCAVKRSIDLGNISSSRFNSYLDMLRETREATRF